MNYDLIIFDCDGVLIDSEIIYHRVGSREMTRIGFPLTVERSIELFSGVADSEFTKVIEKEYGRTVTDDYLEATLKKIRDSFHTDLQPVSGISQVINHLVEVGADKCIASNALHEYIVTSLSIAKLAEYFSSNQIFNVSMVKQGKPNPDLFLHAAKTIGVKPANCLVIEDSVVGIKAAKAANIPVIGFLGATHAKNNFYRNNVVAAGPNMIANDTVELLEVLRR